jgi:hypothetical protein
MSHAAGRLKNCESQVPTPAGISFLFNLPLISMTILFYFVLNLHCFQKSILIFFPNPVFLFKMHNKTIRIFSLADVLWLLWYKKTLFYSKQNQYPCNAKRKDEVIFWECSHRTLHCELINKYVYILSILTLHSVVMLQFYVHVKQK